MDWAQARITGGGMDCAMGESNDEGERKTKSVCSCLAMCFPVFLDQRRSRDKGLKGLACPVDLCMWHL